jgi:hypothetical protein
VFTTPIEAKLIALRTSTRRRKAAMMRCGRLESDGDWLIGPC